MGEAKAGANSPPTGVNLGVIPENFHLTYGLGPQIIHVDTGVTHTGKPSIRLDQHTTSDVNIARECDGTWYDIKPGDHVIARVWIKTDPSSLGDTDYRHGGRVGMDFYAHTSAGYGVVDGASEVSGGPATGYIPGQDCVLNWNRPWTQKGWDMIVPSSFYTHVHTGGVFVPCNPVQIDSFVVWFDVRPVADAGKVWFADGELYINPVQSPSATSYTLTINLPSTGGGTTSPAVGRYRETAGAVVVVTATPNAGYLTDWLLNGYLFTATSSMGYSLTDWFLDGCLFTATHPGVAIPTTLCVTMDRDHTIQPVFKQISVPTSVRWFG